MNVFFHFAQRRFQRSRMRLPSTCLYSPLLKSEALHKLSPLGRSSTPADVAATVKFALDNASITGTTLLVDGGQHLMRFERDFSLMHPGTAPGND